MDKWFTDKKIDMESQHLTPPSSITLMDDLYSTYESSSGQTGWESTLEIERERADGGGAGKQTTTVWSPGAVARAASDGAMAYDEVGKEEVDMGKHTNCDCILFWTSDWYLFSWIE